MFQWNIVEKIKTDIVTKKFSSENCDSLVIMWENIVAHSKVWPGAQQPADQRSEIT
jgi:hypothetical protein